jgi:LAS superfamily LD-carboxypeptidase LdcB
MMREMAAQEDRKQMSVGDSERPRPASSAAHAPVAQGAVASLLGLQRTRGNRYVQRMLDHPSLQRKCNCDASPAQGGPCTECDDEPSTLQRSTSSAERAADETQGVVQEVLNRPGVPLDAPARAFAESRLDEDFSSVRVHTDALAARSARAVDATAYTVGQHIVFGSGQYAPRTREGQHLLLHELTHTVQQREADAPRLDTSLRISDPAEPSELEADAVAAAAMRDNRAVMRDEDAAHAHGASLRIARDTPPVPKTSEGAAAPKSLAAPAKQEGAAPKQEAEGEAAEPELKDADIERWMAPVVAMLVKNHQTVLNESYVKGLLDQREEDPALAKAFEEARKKVRPSLQHPGFAAVLSAPDATALPSFFAVRVVPIVVEALKPGAQDVLRFIEQRFVRDSGVTTLDLLESMGKNYKDINWVYDDYPGGTTVKGGTAMTVTVVGGSITVDSAAVSAAPEKKDAKESAQDAAAKKESRSVAISGEITITNAQAIIKTKDETNQTPPGETIVIANNNKKQSAQLNVVGAQITTNGKRTTLSGGTATIELNKDTQARFIGPHEADARRLAEDFKRVLPEMRPNTNASAVLKESEFKENKEDWWHYIESELSSIPGDSDNKLNRLALPSFLEMRAAARRDGVTLDVLSSHRNFEKAEKHAAAAGNTNKVAAFSSHMLGLAIDFRLSHRDLTPHEPQEEADAEASHGGKAKKAEKPKWLTYKPETSTGMDKVIDMRHSPVHKWLFLHAHEYNWHPYHNEPWHWEYNAAGLREMFVANVCRDPAMRNEPVEDSAACAKFLTDVVELLGDPNRVKKAAEAHRKWLAEEAKTKK